MEGKLFIYTKAALSLVLFLSFGCASIPNAMEVTAWHATNSVKVAWDPVSPSVENEAVTAVIEYEVGTASINRSNPTPIWRGVETEATITLPGEGKFVLWVKAYLMVDGKQVGESAYAWSNDPAAVKNGETFGVVSTNH